MTAMARKLLVAFALLGLAASSAATYVHYNLLENPDYSSFCDVNATVSCRAAYLSRFGSVAGVPVAVGGFLFFTWVLLLLWGSRGKSRIKDSAPAYIFVGSTLGLAVTLYLAYASFFILKEVCPLCVATYVAVIGLFVVSGGVRGLPVSRVPARALRDMRLLVATPVALLVALVFIAGASWGMRVFPREAATSTAPPPPALSASAASEFDRWWDLQTPTPDFPYPNNGAAVVIVEFADFQCVHCRQMYLAYKPILDKYQAAHPDDVKSVLKLWPITSVCNPSVPGVNFTATCEASAAYIMAKQKGTADKLKDWFFQHQEELSPATVRRAAAEIGGIADFDAQYSTVLQEVKADAAIGSRLGVGSTPAFWVNGRRIPKGGLPPEYLNHLIERELKKAK